MKWRLPYRLIQLSPLVVLVSIAAVWFSLPAGVRMVGVTRLFMIGVPEEYRVSNQEIQVSVMEEIERWQAGSDVLGATEYGSGDRPVDSLARRTSSELGLLDPPLCDERGIPRALTAAEEDTTLAGVTTFEQQQNAEVVVLVLPPAERVPVVVSSLVDTSVLTPDELAEFGLDGTIDAIRLSAAGLKDGVPLPRVDVMTAGASDMIASRNIAVSALVLDGHLWEAYTVGKEGLSVDPLMGGLWQSIDDENLAWTLENAASGSQGCAFIVGPVEAEPLVLRPAPGMNAEDNAHLWDLIVPRAGDQALWQPVALWGDARAAAGGAPLGEMALAGSDTDPRVAVIALYDTHPRIPELWDTIGRGPGTRLRVWMGGNILTILAALGVLLLASLVASPLAFRAERLYVERIEVGRERARVQNETERRVVERLNELSARMDAVIAVASDTTVTGMEDVAEDIESTIAELRAILGSVSLQEHPDE